MKIRFLIYFFHLICIGNLHAQPIIFLTKDRTEELGKYTSILKDSTRILNIQDVFQRNNEFILNNKKVFKTRPTYSAFWIRFKIKNLTDKNYYLEIDNPIIDELDLYTIKNNKFIHLQHTGDFLPFSKRQIDRNNYIFPLDLPKGEMRIFYIRYTSIAITEIPLIVGTPEAIIERLNLNDLSYGIFYGIIIVSIFYNFFLFIIVRDKTYLLYVAYITVFGLFLSQLLGHSFQFLFPNYPGFNNLFGFITCNLAGITLISFGTSFLQSRKRAPKLHIGSYFFLMLFIIAIIITFIDKRISNYITTFGVLLVTPYMIILGIIVYRQGYKPARFYLIASASILISITFFGIQNYAALTYTLLTKNVMQLGLVFEAILLSLALGDRYNILKREKDEVQRNLNMELESKVIERTHAQEELKKINLNLLKSNTDLDNFIYTASHDLKAPISNLEGLLTLIKDPEFNQEQERLNLVEMMSISVENFKKIIGELQEISRVQKNHANDVQTVNFNKVCNEILMELKPEIEKSEAIIHMDFNECSEIVFSKTNINRIFYNLLSNAIKYRSSERILEIFINANQTDDFIILSVTDNGMGMNKMQQNKIFSMIKRFHTHVEGRGIGLYIVNRIVENEGGRMEVKSEVGKGSVFTIYFRKKNN